MPTRTAPAQESERSEGGGRRSQRLSRSQRLTESRVFRETYERGRSFAGKHMVMWLRSGEGAALRLGVVASRRVGNAVRRARAKRRLREAYRRNRRRFRGDFDVILVARHGIVAAPWAQVEEDLLALAHRAGLTAEDKERTC